MTFKLTAKSHGLEKKPLMIQRLSPQLRGQSSTLVKPRYDWHVCDPHLLLSLSSCCRELLYRPLVMVKDRSVIFKDIQMISCSDPSIYSLLCFMAVVVEVSSSPKLQLDSDRNLQNWASFGPYQKRKQKTSIHLWTIHRKSILSSSILAVRTS